MSDNLNHRRRTAFPAFVVTVMAITSALTFQGRRVVADEPDTKPAPKLSVATAQITDLAWMAGTWRAVGHNTSMEERWSSPLGDSIVGTFRWLRGDTVWRYDLHTISKDNGRLFFWLKHFTRKLASWEEKDEAISLAITHIEANKVVFKNDKYEALKRVTFYCPVPETLVVTFEGMDDGAPTRTEYQYSKVAS